MITKNIFLATVCLFSAASHASIIDIFPPSADISMEAQVGDKPIFGRSDDYILLEDADVHTDGSVPADAFIEGNVSYNGLDSQSLPTSMDIS